MIGPVLDPDERLPKAFGGCTCHCHRMPNVFHCVPCCQPGQSLFGQVIDIPKDAWMVKTEPITGDIPPVSSTPLVMMPSLPYSSNPFFNPTPSSKEDSSVLPDRKD